MLIYSLSNFKTAVEGKTYTLLKFIYNSQRAHIAVIHERENKIRNKTRMTTLANILHVQEILVSAIKQRVNMDVRNYKARNKLSPIH